MNNYRMKPLENTRDAKRRIIEKVERQIEAPTRKKRNIMKSLIAAAIFLLCIGFSAPILQQAFTKQDLTIERLELSEIEYGALIQSQYVEETREILYDQQNALYIYDIDEQLIKQVASADDGVLFSTQLSKDWLVYEHITDEETMVIAVNRHTGEAKSLKIDFIGELQLSGDYLTYMQHVDYREDEFIRYNLRTGESDIIASISEWDSVKTFVQQEKFIVFEQQLIDGEYQSIFTVLDLSNLQQLGQFTTNFRSINNIQLRGQELYMLYIDEGAQKIGSYHLQTNEFVQLQLDEKIDDFATDGEYFAVAVGNAGSSTVHMYKRNGVELLKTNALNHISERTVRPRFQDNTFIVNGETTGNPLYLIQNK